MYFKPKKLLSNIPNTTSLYSCWGHNLFVGGYMVNILFRADYIQLPCKLLFYRTYSFKRHWVRHSLWRESKREKTRERGGERESKIRSSSCSISSRVTVAVVIVVAIISLIMQWNSLISSGHTVFIKTVYYGVVF